MTRNYVYVFQRPTSDERPPRFRDIFAKFDERGISKVEMRHPERDPNKIELTTEFSGNTKNLEEIFRGFGYSLSENV